MFADGARRYMDGLAIHAYPTDTSSDGSQVWDPAALPRWLLQVDQVAAAAGVSPPPVWITETGVSTTTEHGFPPALTPQQQASDLLSLVHTAQADRQVRMVIIHTLQDAPTDVLGDALNSVTGGALNFDFSYNQINEGMGVFQTNWTPKPAACELSLAFGGSLTC
jgi:hypothetical protein